MTASDLKEHLTVMAAALRVISPAEKILDVGLGARATPELLAMLAEIGGARKSQFTDRGQVIEYVKVTIDGVDFRAQRSRAATAEDLSIITGSAA